MKFNIRTIDPHEWRKLLIEEDNREVLVRHFKPGGLEDAVGVVDIVARVAGEHNLQDQVQFSLDVASLMIFLHYSDAGPIKEPIYKLADAIDSKLELS